MKPLINLLPYRPIATGLSRYVERLLKAWPESMGKSLPLQLRFQSNGIPELTRSLDLPKEQNSLITNILQSSALAQHIVPIKSLLNQSDIDIIYSPYTDKILSYSDLPQVITCHDLTPLYYANSRRAYWRSKFWLPIHLKGSKRIIAISKSVADLLVKAGIPSDKIEIVYNGIETESSPLRSPVSGDFLILARHAKNKNLELALKGFAHFLKIENDWEGDLVVVGKKDRATSSLLRLANELSISARIIWIDELETASLKEKFYSSYCLISPSLMEGFDYPLLEGMVNGLPTLASDIAVHRELHKNNTILFKLEDEGINLACELKRLVRDRVLWRELSESGVLHARKFSMNSQIKGISKVLELSR